MRKLITIILVLAASVAFGQTTYQLNYDSIRVGKTAGNGATSLYGKTYLKNATEGTPSDSVLTVRNGRVYKIAGSAISSVGFLTYVFSRTASDISGYEQMPALTSYTIGSADTATVAATTTPAIIQEFATNTGFPNTTLIPAGVFNVTYQTKKNSGSQSYYTYAIIYKRNLAGTETAIATTNNSSSVSANTVQTVNVSAVSPTDISLLTTDRIIVKIFAVMVSGTANISIYYDDATDSRLAFPSALVDATNFVPYNGAVKDLVSAFSITGDSIKRVSGTGAQFLMGNGTVQDTTTIQTVSNFFPKGDTRYLRSTTASSTYLPLTGGTLTGGLIGTTATFSATGNILSLQRSGATNANWAFSHNDSGGNGYLNLSNVSTSKSLINFGDNGAIGFNTVTPYSLTNYRFISTSDITGGGLVMQKAGVNKGAVYSFNDNVSLESTSGLFMSVGGLLGAGISGLEISAAGVVKIPQLTGSVTDMMVIDNAGNVSRQTIPSGGGGGTVVSVGVSSANGFAGTSSGGANPALTLSTTITADVLKANGTAISAATTTGTSGSAVVLATSPTLVTPNLGTPSTLVGTNITGTAAGLTAGAITGQANSATITAATTATINTISLRDGNADIAARTFNMNPAYGDFAPNKLVGTSVSGQIREMSQAQAKTYLDLSGTNTGDQTTITGNAGTATALQTARNIQGVSFNGTADINPINGTGFVKASGTTLSYDNTTYAPLNSPTFTGTPTLPTGTIAVTQSPGNNSTAVATTAYVDVALSSRTNRILKDWYTDANNVNNTETDLYDYTVPSNTLVNNGDKLYFEIGGIYGGTANSKDLRLYFGNSGYLFQSTTASGSNWTIKGFIVKVDATNYRIVATNSDDAPEKISTYSSTGTVTNYTGTNVFKITGTGTASADITAKAGYLEFKPAAP